MPKKPAIIAEAAGTVSINEVKKMRTVTITPDDGGAELSYQIPFGTRIVVSEGQHVEASKELTEGYKAPADILRISGIDAVYDYITLEVQKVYRSQSININDKHIEVITRQMTRRVKVEESGDTNLLSGSSVDINEFLTENGEIEKRIANGEISLQKATCSPILLGITKAALLTESFLSAASFQETTKVLTEAAIKGKEDHLLGLKENVIIGKLIPAGTGMEYYRNVEVERTHPTSDVLPGLEDDPAIVEAIKNIKNSEEAAKNINPFEDDEDDDIDDGETDSEELDVDELGGEDDLA